MRVRTAKEKEALGKINPILRKLSIKQGTRGYMPLVDTIIYAYANPDKKFSEILKYLEKENFYVGVKEQPGAETEDTLKNEDFRLRPSMVRTIETALEGTDHNILAEYGLENLCVILQDMNGSEEVSKEEQLLAEIGEKYVEYDKHEERVIAFFAKKVLKYIQQH